MQDNKIIILGCGHGGLALAADLKLKGIEVAIWSDKNHATKFNKLKAADGRIVLEENGLQQEVKIDFLSQEISEILEFGDIIYNCTPMVAHAALFEKIISNIQGINSKKILVNFSGVFSGVEQYLNNENKAGFKKIKIFDTSTFPYACRADDANKVVILGRKSKVAIAPLFTSDREFINQLINKMPAKINLLENIFKLGLVGTNAVFHPATMLFNARLIDDHSSFLFYKEGVSKKTARLHEALDKERIKLATRMGYNLLSCVEADNKDYQTNFHNTYDFSVNSKVHEKIQAPSSLNHRFISEDIPFGLVPLLTLGKLYGMKLPNIESVINIFSTIMNIDYLKQGRNLNGLTISIVNELLLDSVEVYA